MLDKEDENIDAVVVATPDHCHAIVSMAAIKRGKHVYCEKPLTHTVCEARAVAEAAREHKVATQMGNQGQACEETRLLCETIWDGAIGQVHEVHVWTDRPLNGINNVTGRRVWTGPTTRRLFPTRSIGTSGSVRRRCVRIIRHTCHSTGAAGGISAPARSATSAATARPRVPRPEARTSDERRGLLFAGQQRDLSGGVARDV